MSTWHDGYVVDQPYTEHFFSELSPAHLQLVAWQNDVCAPDVSHPFRWLELGCGHGVSAAIFAAQFPHGEFHALDFNPQHIVAARLKAKAAGLENLHYHELSFAEAAQQSWQAFDFIVLHGVWSWINDDNRQWIVQLLRTLLSPGGMVYVSYNCLPGRAVQEPVRYLLTHFAEKVGGDSVNKALQSREKVKAVLQPETRLVKQLPVVASLLEKMADQSPHYLAHEYLNKDWYLCYSNQLAAMLDEAKLSRVGSALLSDNIGELRVPPAQADMLDMAKDEPERELLRDFIVNAGFRKDVFVRGKVMLPVGWRYQQIKSWHLHLKKRPAEELKMSLSWGEVSLPDSVYRPIIDGMQQGASRFADLQSMTGLPDKDLLARLNILIAAQIIEVIFSTIDHLRLRQYNRAMISGFWDGKTSELLLNPQTGQCEMFPPVEQLFIYAFDCKLSGTPVDWHALHTRLLGMQVTIDGEPYHDGLLPNLEHLAEKVSSRRLHFLREEIEI